MTCPDQDTCPFCEIIRKAEYDVFLSNPGMAAVFEPLTPHVPGHLLVVPWLHVTDMTGHLEVTGATARYAAMIAARMISSGQCEAANLITSAGVAASQSVMHLHWHVIPRGAGDGLMGHWPWRCGTAHDQNPGPADYETLRAVS